MKDMAYSASFVVENKDLLIKRSEFEAIVRNQSENENILVSICELGLCVVAKRPISRGQFIYQFTGPVINFADTKSKNDEECMSLQFGPDQYLDTDAPGRFINHSCDPNAGITRGFDLVAIQDIGLHEEIRFDYSTTMDEDSYRMECKCGKESCRGEVTDFKLLPAPVQARYLELGIVMEFIRNDPAQFSTV